MASSKLTDTPEDLWVLIGKLRRFFVVNVRWFTRATMLGVGLLILLHQIYPPSVEWVGRPLGLREPSLAGLLGLVAFVLILERVADIEKILTEPPSLIDETRRKAYNRLSQLIDEHGARRVALLQVSGQNVVRFLRDLGDRYPKAEVRLLVMQPDAAAAYDTDLKPDHGARIRTTVQELDLMEVEIPDFKVQRRYYKTPPGISAIVVDDDIVSISWYALYQDPDNASVVRIRGHLAPTITVVGDAARPLLSYARERFEAIWKTAEDAPRPQGSLLPSGD